MELFNGWVVLTFSWWHLLLFLCLLLYANASSKMDRYDEVNTDRDKDFTWHNKWFWVNDKRVTNDLPKWKYYILLQPYPRWKEKFFLSSSILVAFTDKWHTWKSMKTFFMYVCMVQYASIGTFSNLLILDLIVIWFVQAQAFNLIHSYRQKHNLL